MTKLFEIADKAIEVHGKDKVFNFFSMKLKGITELKSFQDVEKRRAYKSVLMYIVTLPK